MRVPIRILATMPSKDHQVTMYSSWSSKPIPVVLNFTSPLSFNWRLHTVQNRKFVQVIVTGQCDKALVLESSGLTTAGDMCKVIDLNPTSSQVSLLLIILFVLCV